MTLTFALGLLQIILHWAARATLLQVTSIQSGPVWNTPGLRLGRCSLVVLLSLTHVRLFEIPWIAACQAPLSFSISQTLLKFMSKGFPWPCVRSYSVIFFVCLLDCFPHWMADSLQTVKTHNKRSMLQWYFFPFEKLPMPLHCLLKLKLLILAFKAIEHVYTI